MLSLELSKRTFGVLIVGTLALLLYVHQQVSIFQFSYDIEKKERQIARLSEDYKRAKFALDRLRSPHALNERLKASSLELITPRDQEVIRILKLQPIIEKTESAAWSGFQFGSLLHFVKEAQAKTFSSKE
jgi:hypothetical protein